MFSIIGIWTRLPNRYGRRTQVLLPPLVHEVVYAVQMVAARNKAYGITQPCKCRIPTVDVNINSNKASRAHTSMTFTEAAQ